MAFCRRPRPLTEKAEARSVEHLHVNEWLLRPGSYSVEVSCEGATAQTNITLPVHGNT
jgi:hypothetical protein